MINRIFITNNVKKILSITAEMTYADVIAKDEFTVEEQIEDLVINDLSYKEVGLVIQELKRKIDEFSGSTGNLDTLLVHTTVMKFFRKYYARKDPRDTEIKDLSGILGVVSSNSDDEEASDLDNEANDELEEPTKEETSDKFIPKCSEAYSKDNIPIHIQNLNNLLITAEDNLSTIKLLLKKIKRRHRLAKNGILTIYATNIRLFDLAYNTLSDIESSYRYEVGIHSVLTVKEVIEDMRVSLPDIVLIDNLEANRDIILRLITELERNISWVLKDTKRVLSALQDDNFINKFIH